MGEDAHQIVVKIDPIQFDPQTFAYRLSQKSRLGCFAAAPPQTPLILFLRGLVVLWKVLVDLPDEFFCRNRFTQERVDVDILVSGE